VSTAALPISSRSYVPAQLAGWIWWVVAAAAALGTAVATMYSLQLGCSIVVYVLVVGVHARSRRAGYVGVWLAWLLLPFVRRIFGLTEGYVSADPLAALPFIITATVAAIELWRGPVSRRAWYIIGAAAGAYLIGIPKGLSEPSALAFGLMAYWTGILCFGLGYREALDRPTLPIVLLVTMPGLAIYGLIQYFTPLPAWDSTWLQTVDLQTAGAPEAGKIRVWSTMNSPGTFGLMLGLTVVVYLVARRFGPLRAAGLGLVLAALALTYVRSAWVALALTMIVLLVLSRGRIGTRVGLILAAIVIGVPVLSAGTGTGSAIIGRFDSLGNLSGDQSAQERVAKPTYLLPYAIQAPLGYGVGAAGETTRLRSTGGGVRASDNAWLALMLQLGPVGLLLVVGALVAGIRNAWYNARRSARRADLLVIALLTYLTAVAFTSDVFYGVSGMILWYLVGMAVARREQLTGEGVPA
jgi:putative inorganic carbon (hco3(-)) transporter